MIIVAAVMTAFVVSAVVWVVAMALDKRRLVYVAGAVFFACMSAVIGGSLALMWFVALRVET